MAPTGSETAFTCLFLLMTLFLTVGVVCSAASSGENGGKDVVVNVRYFGALGDGVTKDGRAIEEAVDYLNALPQSFRPTLLFPPGTYIITGSSNFSASAMKQGVKTIEHDNVTI